MLPDFEFKFSQHEMTVRRAEQQARLLAAPESGRPATKYQRPSRRVSVLLRRLAGTSAAA